jgi:hypothetical protein
LKLLEAVHPDSIQLMSKEGETCRKDEAPSKDELMSNDGDTSGKDPSLEASSSTTSGDQEINRTNSDLNETEEPETCLYPDCNELTEEIIDGNVEDTDEKTADPRAAETPRWMP